MHRALWGILLVSVLAHAQRDPRRGPAPNPLTSPQLEPLPRLKPIPGEEGSAGPDGNVAYRGELVEPFCFKKMEFCATPGMKLTLWTQRGVLRALQAIESPVPFVLFGVRFAANSKVEPSPNYPTVSGRLEAPIEVDGRLVKGQVELQFQDHKLIHAQLGTLAREAVIEGWKVPADYSFDLRNLASGSVLLTGFEGAPPAIWVGEARPGLPTKATSISQWRDDQGAKNLRVEAVTSEKFGGLEFGPGTVTFMQRDQVSAVGCAVNTAFERGAVRAPRGSYVVLCGGELQMVKNEDVVVRVGAYVTSKLDAVRERSPRGFRNDLYGQKVMDECSEGALLGYTFLPQYCPSCTGDGRVPSLVVVDLKGEPRDEESRAMLAAFPSSKKASCAPCR